MPTATDPRARLPKTARLRAVRSRSVSGCAGAARGRADRRRRRQLARRRSGRTGRRPPRRGSRCSGGLRLRTPRPVVRTRRAVLPAPPRRRDGLRPPGTRPMRSRSRRKPACPRPASSSPETRPDASSSSPGCAPRGWSCSARVNDACAAAWREASSVPRIDLSSWPAARRRPRSGSPRDGCPLGARSVLIPIGARALRGHDCYCTPDPKEAVMPNGIFPVPEFHPTPSRSGSEPCRSRMDPPAAQPPRPGARSWRGSRRKRITRPPGGPAPVTRRARPARQRARGDTRRRP